MENSWRDERNIDTVESRIFFNLYIGNNRNLPITDENDWSLEIR